MKIKRSWWVLGVFAILAKTICAQNDGVANAQHLILGQNASGVVVNQMRNNTHPDAQWFPKVGFGLFIHLGISAVHGGIDLSWGMFANKTWEDETVNGNTRPQRTN